MGILTFQRGIEGAPPQRYRNQLSRPAAHFLPSVSVLKAG